MAEHNEIGKIGEQICRKFLTKHGFTIIEINYRTKYGEIDIITTKDNVLRFIEVKSVKVRDFAYIKDLTIQPEDNLTKEKWRKIITSIEIFLQKKNISTETRWQVDLACVYINTLKREGLVKLLENIHKE